MSEPDYEMSSPEYEMCAFVAYGFCYHDCNNTLDDCTNGLDLENNGRVIGVHAKKDAVKRPICEAVQCQHYRTNGGPPHSNPGYKEYEYIKSVHVKESETLWMQDGSITIYVDLKNGFPEAAAVHELVEAFPGVELGLVAAVLYTA